MNPPEKAKFLRRVLSDLLIFCVLYETEKRNAVKKTLIYPCSLDKDILYDRFAAHPLDLRTADGSILDTTSPTMSGRETGKSSGFSRYSYINTL